MLSEEKFYLFTAYPCHDLNYIYNIRKHFTLGI